MRHFTGIFLLIFIFSSTSIAFERLDYQTTLPEKNLAGSLKKPTAIVLDSSGLIYMADADLKAVRVFDAAGQNALFDIGQSRQVQLGQPVDLAMNANDEVYVLDQDKKSLYHFNKNGELLRMIGLSGDKPGQFSRPVALAVDGQENIYVADDGNKTVHIFTKEGMFLDYIDLPRDLPFGEIVAITVDPAQNLYILDAKRQSIFVYNVVRELTEVVSGFGSMGLEEPVDLIANPRGQLFILDQKLGNITQVEGMNNPGSVGRKISAFGSRGKGSPGTFDKPVNLYLSETGDRVYILDQKTRQAQVFQIVDNTASRLVFPEEPVRIVYLGEKDFAFRAMCADSADIVIVGWNGDKLTFFNENAETSEVIAGSGLKDLRLDRMAAVSCAADGSVYALDEAENQIVQFDRDRRVIRKFGKKGSNPGEFKDPTHIGVTTTGELLITDRGNKRLQFWSADGVYLRELSKKTVSLGIFVEPGKTVTSPQGDLYVWERKNNKILWMDPDGFLMGTVTLRGEKPEKDGEIGDLTVDIHGNLYVLNRSTGQIEVYSGMTKPITRLSSYGDLPYQFTDPQAIAVSPHTSRLYVYDHGDRKTKVFGFLRQPPTPERVKIEFFNNQAKLTWECPDNPEITEFVIARHAPAEPVEVGRTTERFWLIPESTEPTDAPSRYLVKAMASSGMASEYSKSQATDFISLAVYAEDRTDYLPALKHYEDHYRNYSTDPNIKEKIADIYLKLGQEMMLADRLTDAGQYYQSALLIVPQNIKIHMAMAEVYARRGQHDEALRMIQQAIAIDPSRDDLQARLVETYLQGERFNDAINFCLKRMDEGDQSFQMINYLARAYEGQGNYHDALYNYKRLLLLEPEQKDIHVKIGDMYAELAEYNQAIEQYNLAQDPAAPRAIVYFKIGQVSYRRGDFAEAARHYEEALRIDNQAPMFFYELGKAYAANDQHPLATPHFQRAIELAPQNLEYHMALGQNYSKLSQLKQAITEFELCIQLAPENARAHGEAGRNYLRNAQLDPAIAALEKALELSGSDEYIADLARAREEKIRLMKNRPPVEIASVAVHNVFPALYKYYANFPLGKISITNNSTDPIIQVKVSLKIEGIMDHSTDKVIPQILPLAEEEVLLTANLNNTVLDNTADTPMTAEVTITYVKDNEQKTIQRSEPFLLLNRNAITWDDKKRIAAFITPLDPVIDELLRELTLRFKEQQDFSLNRTLQQAAFLFAAIGEYGIRYQVDPNSSYTEKSQKSGAMDFLQFPGQTLQRKLGDCDDLMILFCACLEKLGIHTAYVDIPGHVFMMFDIGLKPRQLVDAGIDPQKVVVKWDRCWIPVETTMIGQYFSAAWQKGVETFTQQSRSSIPPAVVAYDDAAQIYPSVTIVHRLDHMLLPPTISEIYDKDYSFIKRMAYSVRSQKYEDILAANPNNELALNKLAILKAKNNELNEAQELFDKIVQLQPDNPVALNNLGNVNYLNHNYDRAIELYQRAYELDSADAYILVNLARVYRDRGMLTEARQFYQQAYRQDPGVATRFSELDMELHN